MSLELTRIHKDRTLASIVLKEVTASLSTQSMLLSHPKSTIVQQVTCAQTQTWPLPLLVRLDTTKPRLDRQLAPNVMQASTAHCRVLLIVRPTLAQTSTTAQLEAPLLFFVSMASIVRPLKPLPKQISQFVPLDTTVSLVSNTPIYCLFTDEICLRRKLQRNKTGVDC